MRLKKQLIELLNIYAPSGSEKPVRDYLLPYLNDHTDKTIVDDYGNLLAEKKCGNGLGATILLSAHMDTVKNVDPNRELIISGNRISSSKGALGADDRAGIAIILQAIKNIDKIDFDGHIKVAFSREEEIGCIGAGKINPKWYSDVDLAIVVDRRGNSDIVVGTMSSPFCSDNVGNFMEDVSEMIDSNYQCTEGGISDALVFSENGINSINISCGYYNEHSDREYVWVHEMGKTLRMILQTAALINHFYVDFGEVPRNNKWVESYSYKWGYYEDEFYIDNHEGYNDMWGEVNDPRGDTFVYEIGDNEVIIEQGDNVITLHKDNVISLIRQLEPVQKQKV